MPILAAPWEKAKDGKEGFIIYKNQPEMDGLCESPDICHVFDIDGGNTGPVTGPTTRAHAVLIQYAPELLRAYRVLLAQAEKCGVPLGGPKFTYLRGLLELLKEC